MREPWTFKTGGNATLTVTAGTKHATLSASPEMIPGIPAVALTLTEIEELRGALGRAAAHLRAERAKTA